MNRFIQTTQSKIAFLDSKPTATEHSPTVVFIHGHCTNKSFFSKQIESPLLTDYRLLSLDLPGYGESEAPTDQEKIYSWPGFAQITVEFIEHLKLDNFIIVGWSLGGHVALETTSLLDKLKGLLIFGTPPIEVSAEGLGRGFKIANPKILECFGKGNLSQEEAELMATISGYDYTKQKQFIVDAVLNTDEGAKIIYPHSILRGIGQNERSIVANWPKPIAVLGGEEDAGINNDYIINDVTFKNLWRKKIHLIPQAGHAVHMDQPSKFNALLKQFLQDVFL